MSKRNNQKNNHEPEIKVGQTWEPEAVISSACLRIDSLLKHGGYPLGSIVQYYSPPGKEGSGKSSLGLAGLAEHQKLGYKIGVVDAELTPMDEDWLTNIGIKLDKSWHYSRPTNGEQVVKTINTMVKKHGCQAVMLDSIDMARPHAYHESEPGDAQMGSHAKLVRKLYQDMKDLAENYNCTFIVVNQSRDPVSDAPYKMPEKLTGGQASYYYPTISIRMRRGGTSELEEQDLVLLTMQIQRSKLGASWRKFTTGFIQGYGFDMHTDMLMMAREKKILKQRNTKSEGKHWARDWDDKVIGYDTVEARNWVFDNEGDVAAELIKHDEFAHLEVLNKLATESAISNLNAKPGT